MNIDEATRATRKYQWVCHDGEWFVEGTTVPESVGPFETLQEAACACDRLNLLAVLACIREESDAMCAAGAQNHKDAWGPDAPIFEHSVYRAMIGALIAEVKAQK